MIKNKNTYKFFQSRFKKKLAIFSKFKNKKKSDLLV